MGQATVVIIASPIKAGSSVIFNCLLRMAATNLPSMNLSSRLQHHQSNAENGNNLPSPGSLNSVTPLIWQTLPKNKRTAI